MNDLLRRLLADSAPTFGLASDDAIRAAKIAATKETIRQSGDDPDALVFNHLQDGATAACGWWAREGVPVTMSVTEPERARLELWTDVDLCGGAWARFQRWLYARGLRASEYGNLDVRQGVRLQVVIRAAPFDERAVIAPHLDTAIERAVVDVGRLAIDHVLPRPRYQETHSERLRATVARLMDPTGDGTWSG
jgi:hypothetical protein